MKIRDEEKMEEKREEKIIERPKRGKVVLQLLHNFPFDLPIGRVTHHFEPHGTMEFDRSIITHKDFTENVRKYFDIREV